MTLLSNHHYVTLEIRDNGIGFNRDQIDDHPKRGIGLRNMVERLEAVDGRFTIRSNNEGTVVTAQVPHSTAPGSAHV